MGVATHIVPIILLLVGTQAFREQDYRHEEYAYESGAGGHGGDQACLIFSIAIFFYFIFQRIGAA